MIKQIRADFYRLYHTVGMAIMILIIAGISFLVVNYQSLGGVMVTTISNQSSTTWTTASLSRNLTLSGTLLPYLLLGLFVIILGYEFSYQTYKNTLVSGISRSAFIIGKYVTMLINIVAMVAVFFLAGLVTSVVKGRPLGGQWATILSRVVWNALLIAFFISVIFSLGIVILMATTSQVISTVFIVVYPFLVSIISGLTNWQWLKYFDFFQIADKVSFGIIKVSQLPQYILASLGILIVSIVVSVMVLKRREL